MKNRSKTLRKTKRMRFLLYIILGLISTIALLFVFMANCQPSNSGLIFLQIAIPILSIGLAGMLVSLPMKIVRSKLLLLCIFFGLLIFGIIVYSYQTPAYCSDLIAQILYPVSNTLSAFFPSRGDYNIPICPNPLYYMLFHFLSYFYFAWLGFALFGRKLLNRVIILGIPFKNKNIIWGYSEGGMELAKDMINHTEDAEPIFILDDEIEFDSQKEKALFNKLSDESIIAFNTHYSNLSTDAKDFQASLLNIGHWRHMLKTGKYFSGHRHYFITESQDFNVKTALTVLPQLSMNVHNLKGKKIHLFVRTELDGVDIFFLNKITKELRPLVEVHIFNQSDITARQFVKDHPVLDLANIYVPRTNKKWLKINHDLLTVEGDVNILLLGLGWTGYELMKKLVCDAQYIGDYRVNLVVIDKDYKQLHGRYQYIVEEAAKFGVNICINPLVWLDNKHTICKQWLKGEHCSKEEHLDERYVHQANSQLFYEWLGFIDETDGVANIMRFNRIIVALGDDELNLNTALHLNNFRLMYLGAYEANDPARMPEPIFAHVRDKEKYDYYESLTNPPIRIFGGLKSIYNVETLVDEKLDIIAKLVNHVYCNNQTIKFSEAELLAAMEKKDDIETEWSQCNIFDQDSSRAVSMHIDNFVTLAGNNVERLSKMTEDESYIERLSEIEHKRWNAFHYMRGIREWPMDEVRAIRGEVKGKLLFNDRLVRHICLVDYAQLDDATNKINELGNDKENYKNTDRRIIRHFPIFYKIINN